MREIATLILVNLALERLLHLLIRDERDDNEFRVVLQIHVDDVAAYLLAEKCEQLRYLPLEILLTLVQQIFDLTVTVLD